MAKVITSAQPRILAVMANNQVRIPTPTMSLIVPVAEVRSFAMLVDYIAAKHAFNARRAVAPVAA